MNIKFKIIRFENQINRNEHIKIVGFNVSEIDGGRKRRRRRKTRRKVWR